MPKLPMRKILTWLCPASSSLFLMLGYQRLGMWAAAGVAAFLFLAWLAVRRRPAAWSAGLALAASTVACIIGLTTGGAPAWLMISVTLGLASWDLILLDGALANDPSSTQADLLERIHYPYLGLALGSGLLVGLAGRMIHFQIPFIFMLLLVVLAYFSLDRLFRAIAR